MISILELRKKKLYRFLEGLLAIISIGFLIFLVILAWVNPALFSVLLIIYSFLWLLKASLNVFYTIFSFKESNRWQTFDFEVFFGKNDVKNEQNSDNSQKLEISFTNDKITEITENNETNLISRNSKSQQNNSQNLKNKLEKNSDKTQVENKISKTELSQELESKLGSNLEMNLATNSEAELNTKLIENLEIQNKNLFDKTSVYDNSLDQIKYLQAFSHHFDTIGWTQKIQKDIELLTNLTSTNSKFQPKNVYQLPIFAVYNEPSSVLIRSLRKILEIGYDLDKIIVIISQEARVGNDFNQQIRDEISKENWIETHFDQNSKETEIKKIEKTQNLENLEILKNVQTLSSKNSTNSIIKQDLKTEKSLQTKENQQITEDLQKLETKNQNINLENSLESLENKIEINLQDNLESRNKNLQINSQTNSQNSDKKEAKLQVYFTEHPDGLVGEIKGKASNEDWGARFGTRIIENLEIDKELVLVTSLDADSYLKRNFFCQLSYRFCMSPNRFRAAFQPVHNYNHNFFQIGFWPRLVATQTTFYNLTNLALEDQISTFAIYSVPLVVLEKVDFWVREVIAEDSLLFLKSLVYFDGDFQVIPFYGQMEADSVEHSDYLEEIISQYRQLQRWAWGGVEGFPYLFWQFFGTPKGKLIDTRIRLKWLYLLFSNHFFWATTPLIFGLGPFVPNFLHGNSFMSTSVSQNLTTFSQFFAWISLVFTLVFGYLTIFFIALKNTKSKKLTKLKAESNESNTKLNSKSQKSKLFWQIPKKTAIQTQEEFQLQNSLQNNLGKNSQNEEIKLTWSNFWAILIQIAISPFIYFLMAIPAIDAQIRGLLGNYLGYWVTPKK